MEEFTQNFKVERVMVNCLAILSELFIHSSWKSPSIIAENNANADQKPHCAASDLSLHYLPSSTLFVGCFILFYFFYFYFFFFFFVILTFKTPGKHLNFL